MAPMSGPHLLFHRVIIAHKLSWWNEKVKTVKGIGIENHKIGGKMTWNSTCPKRDPQLTYKGSIFSFWLLDYKMVYKIFLKSLTHIFCSHLIKTKITGGDISRKLSDTIFWTRCLLRSEVHIRKSLWGFQRCPATRGTKIKCRGRLLVGWVGKPSQKRSHLS